MHTFFVDIGGVLLTNGWDRVARREAAHFFQYDLREFEERHKEIYYAYELGQIRLEEYLHYVLFHQERSFTLHQFTEFLFARSKAIPDMISAMQELREKMHCRIFALSNEGREIACHRVEKFHLAQWIDGFIFSSFVGRRKPDPAIYRLALDIAQVTPSQVIYLEDRAPFVEEARSLGLTAIHHKDVATTMKSIKEIAFP
ncbi:MAG: HAD family phosphatase [Verrucomicrobiota bacterium]|nr:HAD family phosphatase [Verrucomicrobiota bacterium]